MNAASKVIVEGNLFTGSFKRLVLAKESIAVLVLFLSVLVSGLVLVYLKDFERRLLNQIEVTQQMNERLQIEHGQLLLEQSTWTTQSRIQRIARDELGMNVPKAEQVILVTK